jgi:hypothetical protein
MIWVLALIYIVITSIHALLQSGILRSLIIENAFSYHVLFPYSLSFRYYIFVSNVHTILFIICNMSITFFAKNVIEKNAIFFKKNKQLFQIKMSGNTLLYANGYNSYISIY